MPAERPIDVYTLEFLAEGDTGGLDLSTLPPIGTPVVASHTITVPIEMEQALQPGRGSSAYLWRI